METDITPIFKNDNVSQVHEQEQEQEQEQEHEQEHEFTPLNEIHEEPIYHNIMPPPPQPYYWPPQQPQPLQPPQWDPFKNISTSTWVILVVAFALGFFIGKFK